MQTKEQMYEQLVVEFATRIARFHRDPARCVLSLEEARGLATLYPIPVLLESLTRAGSFIKNNKTADISVIRNVLRKIADKVLGESHVRGKFLSHRGSQTSASTASSQSPREVSENDVYEVQKTFQELVTVHMLDTQWTLHEDEASALLTKHSTGNLRIAFQDLGEWVSRERREELRFHDQEAVVHELFRRARISQPSAAVGV